MSKRKKEKKPRFPGVIRAFQIISAVCYAFFLLFLILDIGVTERGLKSLVLKYIDGVEVSTEYSEFYLESGLTEEMYQEIFSSKEMKDIIADVMYDRLSALVKNTDVYEHSKAECDERVRSVVEDVCNAHSLSLSEKKISSLTSYTSDISGITAMFIYNTPEMYRSSIFEQAGGTEQNASFFQVAATLSNPAFPVCLAVAYVTLAALIWFLAGKERREGLPFLYADTILYPSFIVIAFSFGELFGIRNTEIIIRYLSKIALTAGIISMTVGILALVFIITARKAAVKSPKPEKAIE